MRVLLNTLSVTIPRLAFVEEKILKYLRPPKYNPQFVALARSFYESRSTIQVIGRTCSEPRTGKVEKTAFSTVRVVLVSTRLLE